MKQTIPNQTPPKQHQNLHLRSADSTNRRPKELQSKPLDARESPRKPQKFIGKSLIPSFSPLTEQTSPQFNESADSSPESDISDEIPSPEPSPVQDLEISPNLPVSAIDRTYITPSLDVIEVTAERVNVVSESVDLKSENLEVEAIVDFIREAGVQASRSSDIDRLSKKILAASVKVMMEERGFLEEEKRFSEILYAKVQIGLFCFFVWIVSVLVFLFCQSGERSFPDMPPPT